MAGLLLVMAAGRLPAATLGTVVPIVGWVSDLVYDGRRDLVHLANYGENRVEVHSVGRRRLLPALSLCPSTARHHGFQTGHHTAGKLPAQCYRLTPCGCFCACS